MAVRELGQHQTHDPARGSFTVNVKHASGKWKHGKKIYVNCPGHPSEYEYIVEDEVYDG